MRAVDRGALLAAATEVEATGHLLPRTAIALTATHFASKVTTQAVQFPGRRSLVKNHPVEHCCRETKLFQLGDESRKMLNRSVSGHLDRPAWVDMSASLAND